MVGSDFIILALPLPFFYLLLHARESEESIKGSTAFIQEVL